MVPSPGTDSGKRLGVEGGFEGVFPPSFSGSRRTTTGSSDIFISDERFTTKLVSANTSTA
jgi:hypothetical protein